MAQHDVRIEVWVHPLTGMASQWHVVARDSAGDLECIHVEQLPFELLAEHALREALDWTRQRYGAVGLALELPLGGE